MAGIVASSATTNNSGDTSADKTISGFIAAEEVTLSTSPAGSTYAWSLTRPSGSSRTILSSATSATPRFTPYSDGLYLIRCVVDGTTEYLLRVAVANIGTVSTLGVHRMLPLADDQVPTPSTGVSIFASSEAQEVRAKHVTGDVEAFVLSTPGLELSTPRYATASALRAVTPVSGQLRQTDAYNTSGDGGNGLWVGVTGASAGTYTHNGGTVIVPSAGDGSQAWVRQYSGPIDVRWFGAKGDGSTDDTSAIQAAIDAVGVTITSLTSGIRESGAVYVPPGDYQLSVPINTYSGVHLTGSGPASRLEAAAGFVGTDLILLEKTATGVDRYQAGHISKLSLKGSTVGGIADATPLTLNSTFSDLYFDTQYGIRITTYAQKVEIRRLYSYGPLDQFVKLSGNDCLIEDIDKEASSGTSAEPFVHIIPHATGDSTGIYLRHILIEGNGSANKSTVTLEECSECVLDGTWSELSATDGFMLHFKNCGRINIQSVVSSITSTKDKIKLENTGEVEIESVTTNANDVPWWDMFSVDSTSFLRINSLESRHGDDLYPLGNVTYSIGRHTTAQRRASGITPNPGLPAHGVLLQGGAQDLMLNGSFEGGIYNWGRTGTIGTDEVIASEVNLGLMLHYSFTGSSRLYQNITIPASAVGIPMTFSGKVKYTGDGNIQPEMGGVGISTSTSYFSTHVVQPGSGWHYITQTFIPQTAGTLQVGIRTNGATAGDIWADDFCVSYGSVAMAGGTARFGSIELGSHWTANGSQTMTVLTAAPTTGTWKRGDVVFNASPSAGGKVGWVCVSAGSPGTWKDFGVIDA